MLNNFKNLWLLDFNCYFNDTRINRFKFKQCFVLLTIKLNLHPNVNALHFGCWRVSFIFLPGKIHNQGHQFISVSLIEIQKLILLWTSVRLFVSLCWASEYMVYDGRHLAGSCYMVHTVQLAYGKWGAMQFLAVITPFGDKILWTTTNYGTSLYIHIKII